MLRIVGVIGTAAALTWALTGSASAATSPDTTLANVNVSTAITLNALTSSFTLTGIPGATVTAVGNVTMNVETNNFIGYAVTVQSQETTLAATALTNPDDIPIEALMVRETGTTDFVSLSESAPVTVHSQPLRSAEGGDVLSNDYEVTIPFVNQDVYTTTLDYVATTL